MVTINGKSVDFLQALPLKLRDWKALEKAGVTPKTLEEQRMTEAAAYLFYVLHKANPDVTQDDVDDLDMDAAAEVLKAVNSLQGQPPKGTSST